MQKQTLDTSYHKLCRNRLFVPNISYLADPTTTPIYCKPRLGTHQSSILALLQILT